MAKTLWDTIRLLFPLGHEKRIALGSAQKYLAADDVKLLRYYLKLDRTFVQMQRFNTTPELFEDKEWPFFKSHIKDDDLKGFLDRIDAEIAAKAKEEAFIAFAPHALERIPPLLARNIIGMDHVKTAAAVQLFAKEPLHLLLLGDPGTGKTDILRSQNRLAPKGSFGLGSGTSGAGLSALAKGDTLILGLLPLADEGIACIDELNLMKPKDSAALYNAMEKGFVTYDKGGKHEQVPARVRVSATANPVGDTFIGQSAEILRKQVPFDDALLSRFHLLFIIRKPNDEEFEQITRHIVQHDASKEAVKYPSAADIAFLKEYIKYADGIDVTLDPSLESRIVAFIKGLKSDERKFITEVGPRTVVGLIRLVKAIARAELAQSVDKSHLDVGCGILRESLYVRKPEASGQPSKQEAKQDDGSSRADGAKRAPTRRPIKGPVRDSGKPSDASSSDGTSAPIDGQGSGGV